MTRSVEKIEVSVILCTHNRAQLVTKTLDSLAKLDKPIAVWELLLIDNNSTDSTATVVKQFAEQLPIHFLFESTQGKCHALNTGLQYAKGALIIFLDDDVVVPANWLNAFIEASSNQRYAWFGGRVKPDWLTKPNWFREETSSNFDGHFGNYDLGLVDHAYEEHHKLPLGASMACRREIFDKVGNFRIDLGPRGKLRGVGDETELLMRAKSNGFSGYYLGTNTVKHHVSEDRLSISGLLNYGIGKGLNQARLDANFAKPKGSFYRIISQFTRGIVQLMGGRGDRFRVCVINIGRELGKRRA